MLTLTERAIKNELKETHSIVQKGGKNEIVQWRLLDPHCTGHTGQYFNQILFFFLDLGSR